MISNTRTLVLAAAIVVAASLATTTECFAVTPLPDPFGGSDVACVGRSNADNKTYIIWAVGNVPFHTCTTPQQLGDETALSDDYQVEGQGGNDFLSLGCVMTCGNTQVRLEADLAWGGHFIDFSGGDGNDWIANMEDDTGALLADSWFFGDAGDDLMVTDNVMGRLIAHGGNDRLRSLSPFAANDWLDGGDGNDCLEEQGGTFDFYDCGPGHDKHVGFHPGMLNCDEEAPTCSP